MGLQVIEKPAGQPDAGLFNLPPAFDTSRFAAEWVLETQVASKSQRQVLSQTRFTADGWTVWRVNKDDPATTVATEAGKKYVLMCRSRKLQDQVNAVFGDVTKKQINRELQGQTAAGEAPQKGILTEERLQREMGGEKDFGESAFKLNLPDVAPAATEVT